MQRSTASLKSFFLISGGILILLPTLILSGGLATPNTEVAYRDESTYYVETKGTAPIDSDNYDYIKSNIPTVQQDGKTIISNFPKTNNSSIKPLETTTGFKSGEKSFYIEKLPITNREYKDFITSTGREAPSHWQDKKIPSSLKDEPVVNVSYEDAAAYAQWARKRLPTYSEFQRALAQFPDLRRGAPLREWTSTVSSRGGPEAHFIIGGKETESALADSVDPQTGFRLASD